MGKEKGNEVPFGAFSRMNFLYQASQLIAKTDAENPLSNFYNKLMKDISKKLVEKLHPDLKRTICIACNYPLTSTTEFINAKVQPNRKKRKKKKTKNQKISEKNVNTYKVNDNTSNKYKTDRIKRRIKKPNRVKWQCEKCGFSKKYLLNPSYELWIHKEQRTNKLLPDSNLDANSENRNS